MIDLAHKEGRAGSREHMGRLLQTYWQPMYAHLRHKGLSHEKAEDIVQEFSVRILDNDLLSIADPKRGRFRTLLLTALDRFAVSQFRYDNAAKRAPASLVSLDASEVDHTRSANPAASAAFDRAFALDVIAQVLAKMKQECETEDQPKRWKVFEDRVVSPALDGVDPPSYVSMAEELGLDGEKAAMNLLVTAKRQFTRLLTRHVRDYVTRNPDIDHYIEAVARSMPAEAAANDSEKAAKQITERAVTMMIDEEIGALKSVLAETRDADRIEIDRQRESAIYKSGFLTRLNTPNCEFLSEAFEWGRQNDEAASDDVVCRSILDTQLGDVQSGQQGTIRQALLGQTQDESVLKSIKDWVNLQRVSRDPLFSREVATSIYYTAIAASLVHFQKRISSLQDQVLARGLDSVLEKDWIEEDIRTVLATARAQLTESDT